MIVKLFNHAHVLYQRTGVDGELPNEAICGCVDSGGTICLRQGGSDDIVINKESVDELCELLRKLKRLAS